MDNTVSKPKRKTKKEEAVHQARVEELDARLAHYMCVNGPIHEAVRGECVKIRFGHCFWYAKMPGGTDCIEEFHDLGDGDIRFRLWAPRETCLQLLNKQLEQRRENDLKYGRQPLNRAGAREWLAASEGCHGTVFMRFVAGLDPWSSATETYWE